MTSVRGDASDIFRFANDLSVIGPKAVPAVQAAMETAGEAFATEWRRNAQATSGDAARFYPASIESRAAFGLAAVNVDVGPNPAKKQGKLAPVLEFGGPHSPPHLDGLRALDVIAPRAEKIVDAAMGFLFDE